MQKLNEIVRGARLFKIDRAGPPGEIRKIQSPKGLEKPNRAGEEPPKGEVKGAARAGKGGVGVRN